MQGQPPILWDRAEGFQVHDRWGNTWLDWSSGVLVANAGHVVSTERLLTHVWGHRGSGDRQLLKQLVHRLRQKIESDPSSPRYLQTESGAGYQMLVD
jgi:4-aminobutyrate aminotransferase-like enzyme